MLKLLTLIGLATLPLLAAKTLDIYTIDVEGGKAVLVISPAGESMLIDVGWGKSSNREASTDLLVASAKATGLKQIDYLVITHYDPDHIGDAPAFAAKFPVRHIVDHGPLTVPNKNLERRYESYAGLFGKIDRIIVKAGDRIPIKGVNVQVLSSAGSLINKPFAGTANPAPSCNTIQQPASLPGDAEDDNSIGLLFTLGKFRLVDLADLEAHLSYDLACPADRIGQVDVYHVNVHGQFKGITPVLLDALRPRVAIMANGATKGGDPQTWPILRAAPGLQDIWQSHFSIAGGQNGNPPPDYIANPEVDCKHDFLKVSARPNGSFTVTNGRNSFKKSYPSSKSAK